MSQEKEKQLMEDEIMKQKLDEEELAAVNGGEGPHLVGLKAPGGCQAQYFARKCVATVEEGSWCWSNDACAIHYERYYEP